MAPLLVNTLSDSFSELIDTRSYEKAQPTSRSKRSVTFAAMQEVRFLPVEDIGRDITWYTKKELDQVKKNNSRSVRAMCMGTHRADPDFCERGLQTQASSIQTKHRKKFAIKLVLEEQKRQQETGEINSEALAEKYEMQTTRSRLAAAAQGQSDALAVTDRCFRGINQTGYVQTYALQYR